MPSNVITTIVNRLNGGPSSEGYVDLADSSNFIQLSKDGIDPSLIIFGTWEATPIEPQYGGTGVSNSNSSTITLGGSLTFSGAFPFIGNLTASTNVTFPTSGTLLTSAIFPVTVSDGGTGETSLTAFMPLCGGTTTTGNVQSVSESGASAGYVLTYVSSSALPTWQPSSGSGFSWVDQTTTPVTMTINTSYVADNSGLVTLTLPTTAPFGSVFQVVGKGAGGWKIAQNSGQQIIFGDLSTTSGASGFLSSTHTNDTVTLVCVTANNEFVVYDSIGNITVN